MIKEVPLPDTVLTRKVIPFYNGEVPMMIYEDNEGLTHIDRDFRVFEADYENSNGHEFRLYRIPLENPEE